MGSVTVSDSHSIEVYVAYIMYRHIFCENSVVFSISYASCCANCLSAWFLHSVVSLSNAGRISNELLHVIC